MQASFPGLRAGLLHLLLRRAPVDLRKRVVSHLPQGADLCILAEYAGQVAAGKKEGAAAPGAADAGLLAVVDDGPMHAGAATGVTGLALVVQPVHTTLPGAHAA